MGRRRFDKKKIVFAWLLLTGFILLILPLDVTEAMQAGFLEKVVGPVHNGRLVLLAHWVDNKQETQPKNSPELINHLVNLEQVIYQQQQRIEELALLRDRYYPLEGAALITADVIQSRFEADAAELLINRGSDDGIKTGFYVLGSNSVIGSVSGVSARTAKVILLTDKRSNLPVRVDGIGRVLQGAGDFGWVTMMTREVEPGTEVLVEKRPGILDSPIIAGRVEQCIRDQENVLLYDLKVTPASDLRQLKSVAVLVMNPDLDQSAN